MKIVKVEWLDACSPDQGWKEEYDARLMPITSVGFVHKETKGYISLAQSKAATDDKSNFITIPKAIITKTTVLRK